MSKVLSRWMAFCFCLIGISYTVAAQSSQTSSADGAAQQAKGQQRAAKARHVFTNEDLSPSQASNLPADHEDSKAEGSAAVEPPKGETAEQAHRGASDSQSLAKQSISELRQQEASLAQQVAGVRQEIEAGPLDSRHDVLVQALEGISEKLRVVRKRLQQAEEQQLSHPASSSPASAESKEDRSSKENPTAEAAVVSSGNSSRQPSSQ